MSRVSIYILTTAILFSILLVVANCVMGACCYRVLEGVFFAAMLAPVFVGLISFIYLVKLAGFGWLRLVYSFCSVCFFSYIVLSKFTCWTNVISAFVLISSTFIAIAVTILIDRKVLQPDVGGIDRSVFGIDGVPSSQAIWKVGFVINVVLLIVLFL